MVERARHVAHLVVRFFASLVPRTPKPGAVAHVRAVLRAEEFEVWQAMPRADRVESIATLHRLPPTVAADERFAAAALLHDSGKTEAGLGTFGRVYATVRGAIGDPETIGGRTGAYLRHPERGAERLRAAGARPEVVVWAAAHHEPARWPVDVIPRAVCSALARADGAATN